MDIRGQETLAKYLVKFISLIGWILFSISLFQLDRPKELTVLLLLVIFLGITEFYPMPVWKGFDPSNFSIVYVIYLVFGRPYTVTIYAFVILIVNLLQQRPLRNLLFLPSKRIISFFISQKITILMMPWLNEKGNVLHGITLYVIFLLSFYIVKNLQIEIVFLTRPQRNTLVTLKKKLFSQMIGAVISLIYGVILYILGSQNRGQIDVFSYFFFFSPLIGLTLLSTFFVRLKKEKNRLKALFSITTDLNKMLPVKDWLVNLSHYFHDFIDVEVAVLWIKENGSWTRKYIEGRFNKDFIVLDNDLTYFNDIKQPILYKFNESETGIIEKCFDDDIQSYIYSPLVVETDTVGMFIIGRNRINSFTEEDVSSIATLANQLAVTIKTRMLIQEQENRLIIEERNRIARDLHDGIAQTLAGTVLKLETAQRKLEVKPEETMHLMTDIIQRLRFSLKEVRESIYAMRPYPTSSVGLISAINKKIHSIRKEYDHKIEFEIRGKEVTLSSMVEKILFDTFQESLTNSLKHAKASSIDILLSYQANHILLKVKDNGIGFSLFHAMIKARNHPHFGILNMNEAAESICASLLIDSKEKGGTEVVLKVPRMGLEGSEVF